MLFKKPSSESFFLVLTPDYERTCFNLPEGADPNLFPNPNSDFETNLLIPENLKIRFHPTKKKEAYGTVTGTS